MPTISASLRADEAAEPNRLRANRGIAFQGMLPGANYVVEAPLAARLLNLEPRYAQVIRPYLGGVDIATDPAQGPSRYIVDFGLQTLEEAMRFPRAIELVQIQAKRDRESSRSYSRNPRWWQFLWPRPLFRTRVADLARFIAGTATGKRILFCWCAPETVASNATNVFALANDDNLGVLMSTIHTGWAQKRSSTLREDIRYTPTSAFETFPWPPDDLGAVASTARQLYGRRSEICTERQIGLTKLYNEVDEGAYRDLRELHVALDEAVAAAYGWPASVAHDPQESNRRLLELNRAIAAGEIEYRPFD